MLMVALSTSLLAANAQRVFNRVERPSLSQRANDFLRPGVKPYVRGGMSVGMFAGEGSRDLGNVVGGMLEGGLEIPFKDLQYGLQPAVRFMMKGGTLPWDGSNNNNATARMNYIEIPINFYMVYPFNERNSIKMALGLYGAYCVSGSATLHESGRSYKYNVFDGSWDYPFRRGDVGAGFEFTYQHSHLQATIGLEAGFLSMQQGMDGDVKSPCLGSVYLNVGWQF